MKDISLTFDNAEDGFPASLTGLPDVTMQQVLFYHCARLYPLPPAYARQQLIALGENRHAELNHLARSCQYYVRKHVHQHARQHGQSDADILARLARRKVLAKPAELIARALLNLTVLDAVRQQPDPDTEVTLPYPLIAEQRPAQPSLLRALLHWPDNDRLFRRVLTNLTSQPALSQTLCRYATAYTPQGKLLDLKHALLLLGPQRSRELVLLAHFESSLIQPVFPLKADILQRYRLIQHVLNRLSTQFSIELPVRCELLAYLLIYDAWRSPEWVTTTRWQTDSKISICRVDHWLKVSRPHQHRIAKRLCQYWRLPGSVAFALDMQTKDAKLNALVGLSVAAVQVIECGMSIHALNAHHSQAVEELRRLFATLTQQSANDTALQAFFQLCATAAIQAEYQCTLPTYLRP